MKGTCIAPTGATATRYGEKPRYPEGLYDLGEGVFAWLVPNGSWGEANAGLITGTGASLLVDTLWDPGKTRVMLDAMEPLLAGAPLAAVVNTHADGDHFWGNQCLPHTPKLTTIRARAEMDHHRPKSMIAFQRTGRVLAMMPRKNLRIAGRYFSAMCQPYDFASVIHSPAEKTFSGELVLHIGGREVRLIEVGPAHTSGDLMVHVPDAKLLFAADIVFIGSTPVMWAGPLDNLLAALDRILDLDVTTIIPGHGPVTDKDGVRSVKRYWLYVAEAARAAFDAGTPPERAAAQIAHGSGLRERGFAHWDSPERMMTNVHLLYRHWSGREAPLGIPEKFNLMRKQALLAHSLPDATPALMHRL